jgi:hypothetical protein
MFSLLPRALTAKNTTCLDQGYSDCGPKDFRHASGTSFSAAQVSAAAAMLFALRPGLRPDQVSELLEHSAFPTTPANGCGECLPGRDALSGWGRLDIAAAVHALRSARLPVRDRFEPDDDVSLGTAIRKSAIRVRATVDYWDDRNDVYRIKLKRGQKVRVVARAHDVDVSLVLWKPELHSLAGADAALRARRSVHGLGVKERLRYRAAKTGWYSLQVVAAKPGSGAYSLRVTRR